MRRSIAHIAALSICLLLGLAAAPAMANPQSAGMLSIAGARALGCPDFEITFRYTDGDQRELTPADVALSTESGQALPVAALRKVTNPPVAVAIVVEASAAMREASLLERTRYHDALERVTELTRRLNTPDRLFSLVTFAESSNLLVSQKDQPRFVTNALGELAARLPTEGPPARLGDALALALEDLAKAPANYNRALFVFAAGSVADPVDASAVRAALDATRANPPAITIVGLGPELEAEAQTLGAPYYPFHAESLAALNEQRRAIDERYSQVTTQSAYYQVQFRARQLAPGQQQVRLTVREASEQTTLEMCPLPPEIAIKEPLRLPGNRLEFGIDPGYTQTPLDSVTYYLNKQAVGSAGPEHDFRLEFAPFAEPGGAFEADREYELSAQAVDAYGSRSSGGSTLIIRMPGLAPSWAPFGLGLLLLGGLVSIGGWLMVQRRRHTTRRPLTAPAPLDTLPPEATEGPETLPPLAERAMTSIFTPLIVHVHDLIAGERYSYELSDAQRPDYDIGLSETNQLVVRRKARGVSRNHATLTPVSGGWELTDTSSYGTYRGDAPGETQRLGRLPVEVQPGDTIWLGKEIRLSLERMVPAAVLDGTLPPDDHTEPPDEGTLPPELPGGAYTQGFRPLRVTVHDARGGDSYSYELRDAAQPSYDIGHSDDSPVRVRRRAEGVSRNHAKLTPVSAGWELTDTSQFGTFLGLAALDDQRLGRLPVEVHPGSTIWLGKEIRLSLEWV